MSKLEWKGGDDCWEARTVDGVLYTARDNRTLGRSYLGFGASYRLPKNSFAASSSVDFAITHTFLRDTRIDVTRTFFDDTPVFTAAQIRANVNSSSNTVSVQYRMAF